jgi:ABC-type phosphate transport system substrate-binding protein
VFLVNEKNPVRALTVEQIKGIYTGKITKWREVGGPDLAVRAFQRDRNSGSQVLFERLVMKGVKPAAAEPMVLEGMMGPINRLNHDAQGLGFSVYYYEQRMSVSPQTRLVAVDGVMPSSETIAKETYPLVSYVYIVTRKDPQPNVAALRDWMLSADGQKAVADCGYVPLRRPARGQ